MATREEEAAWGGATKAAPHRARRWSGIRASSASSMAMKVAWEHGRCRPTDPLLMMQVTELTCGGYLMVVACNHGITDAFGLAQFLQAMGEIARGLPSPSVVPVRDDDSLPDIPQLISAVLKRSPAAFTTSTKLTATSRSLGASSTA
ncbi:hypothetical protein PR202_gb25833 [Eleusine coracana subsp. coracana]|uniref:Uncharacterized protein n=1 Tax=Eleusine coracana subsp. coracana TaxID=191504 RepID=A0AAV5FMQ7_ELECO|nr:hypothetical protein PR202_gb25797 [Eleusine coracana subsp. coracana]GJN36929.1 hypothetical protein PR202_gb25833 [Eleusine coracana subsp. coracana]